MIGNRASLLLSIALLASPATPSAAADDKISLTVNVRGAKPGEGQAICSLFTSPENYLKQPLSSRTKRIDSNGEAMFRFDGLAAGSYAVSVVYDEDLNGKLNTGLLGIPTELIGMSNNAKGTFGPPSFQQASFPLSRSLAVDILLGEAKN